MKRTLICLFIAFISAMIVQAAKPLELSDADFSRLVSDHTKGYNGWEFKGKRPAVIDFYADWCGPCRIVAPSIDSLAKVYNGKVDFYKVNVDLYPDLAANLMVQSIPMLLFCPVDGFPQAIAGAYPGAELDAVIRYLFFPKK